MPTLNIKDEEVHRLAHQLATRRHTTATGAVRDALREALERDVQSRDGIAERILEIAEEGREQGGEFLTDDDIYDEDGLPR